MHAHNSDSDSTAVELSRVWTGQLSGREAHTVFIYQPEKVRLLDGHQLHPDKGYARANYPDFIFGRESASSATLIHQEYVFYSRYKPFLTFLSTLCHAKPIITNAVFFFGDKLQKRICPHFTFIGKSIAALH